MSLIGAQISRQNAKARQALIKRLGDLSREEWPGDEKRARCHLCNQTGVAAERDDVGSLAVYPCACTGRRGWGALWPTKDDPARALQVPQAADYEQMGRDTKFFADDVLY